MAQRPSTASRRRDLSDSGCTHTRTRERMAITKVQLEALSAVIADAQDSTRPADMLLHHFFRAHPALGARDRSIVAEGLFGWLRKRRSLSALTGVTSPRLTALTVLVREFGHSVRE